MEPTILVNISILLLGALCIYRYIIFPGFLSPLAKIPNAHFLAPYTSVWILWTRLQERDSQTIYAAHQKLGSLVRLAPNELSMNSYEDGVRIAYNSGRNWAKPAWIFSIFGNYGIPNGFTTLESKAHAKRRRMITQIYSKSYLWTSQDLQTLSKNILFDELLPLIHKASVENMPLEFLDIARAFAIDYVTAYVYGTSAGSDFLSDVNHRKHWNAIHDLTKKYFVPVGEYATQIDWFRRHLSISLLPDAYLRAIDEFGEWNLSMLRKVEAVDISKDISAKSTTPVDYSTFRPALEKLEETGQDIAALGGPLRMVVASEMLDHILAGYDTVSIALTYMLYELSHNSELQIKLRSEVRSLSPQFKFPTSSPEDLPDYRLLDKLPILHAIVQETLRRWPPAGHGLFRTTPDQLTSLCGYDNIPSGVRVSAIPYTLHRNEEVFPDAESWKPQRWIEASTTQRDVMNKWFWAFGSGHRGCIGVHFATMEMKLVVAAIYSNYETSITTHGDMEQTGGFVNLPKGKMLNLTFEHIV